jgi:hypothetical protein
MDKEAVTGAVSDELKSASQSEPLANGRYVIWKRLGLGAQAETLEAVDRRDGRAVAIKRFSVGHARSWKDVELAEREARVLASLSHPALPAYIDHFEEQGSLYLVMERVEGESLASLGKSGRRLGLDELRDLMTTLAGVLDYLHQRVPPVIHRDIKPGNLIRRPDGTFCLVDFGSVRDGLRPEGGSTVVGTFGYMAPEQFQGRAMPATDVYAVGATIISLLTGKSPDELPHQGLSIDVEKSLAGAAPKPWIQAVTRLLTIDPDVRPSSLRSVLVELDGARPGDAARRNEPTTSDEVAEAEAGREPDAAFTVMVGSGLGFVPFLALFVARLAIFLALGIVVPTVLRVLSIFFGSGLARAAFQVSQAGRLARARIARVSRQIQRAEPFVLQGHHYRRRGWDDQGWRETRKAWSKQARAWKRHARVDAPYFKYDDSFDPQDSEDTERSTRDANSKKTRHES